MAAPIFSSGAMMRPIGRLLSDSSPNMREVKGRAANTPAIRRIPVPELPQSISCAGAVGFIPVPTSVKFCGASPGSTCAPSCCMARRVLRQSSLHRKLRTCMLPCAKAPRIATRCEMLLSPGTRMQPRSPSPAKEVVMQ